MGLVEGEGQLEGRKRAGHDQLREWGLPINGARKERTSWLVMT